MTKKQLFELSSDLADELERIAAENNKSKADVMRQALALYFLVNEEVGRDKKNRRVAIVEGKKILDRYVLA